MLHDRRKKGILFNHPHIDSLISWFWKDSCDFLTNDSISWTIDTSMHHQLLKISTLQEILHQTKNFRHQIHSLPLDGIIRTITPHRNNVLSIIPRSPIRLSVSAPSFLFMIRRDLSSSFFIFLTHHLISSTSSHSSYPHHM